MQSTKHNTILLTPPTNSANYVDSYIKTFSGIEGIQIFDLGDEPASKKKNVLSEIAQNNIKSVLALSYPNNPDKSFNLLKFIKLIYPDIFYVLVDPNINMKQTRNFLNYKYLDMVISDDIISNTKSVLPNINTKNFNHIPGVAFKSPYGQISLGKQKKNFLLEDYNVLLVSTPFECVQTAPLGLPSISSVLKDKFNVKIIDYNIKSWHKYKSKFSYAWDPSYRTTIHEPHFHGVILPCLEEFVHELIDEIKSNHIKSVGFTLSLTSEPIAIYFIKKLRKEIPYVRIFCGGPNLDIRKARKLIFNDFIHAGVIGEAENSVVSLITNWSEGKFKESIPGVVQSSDPDQDFIEARPYTLDKLPLPDFSTLNPLDYTHAMLPLSLSRGCVNQCHFCYESTYWNTFRAKSPETVISEIKHHIKNYGITDFRFHDSLLNGDVKVLEKFLDLLIAENLEIRWSGDCRIDYNLTDYILKKMVKSGCKQIGLGLESGSQQLLDHMQKNTQTNQFEEIFKRVNSHGIKIWVFIIVGHPQERWIDLIKTIKTLLSLKQYIHAIRPAIFEIIPHTKICDKINELELIVPKKNGHYLWRTKNYTNTITIRRIRLFIIKFFISFLRKKQPYNLEIEF